MRAMRICLLAAAMTAVAACVPRAAPPPPPAEEPAPRPAPRPAPPPPPADWRDAPLTPGTWTYRREGGGSLAAYGRDGRADFLITCAPSRQISLTRTGMAGGDSLTVRTTNGARAMPASVGEGGLVATLPAADRFLDAMVFSRGRYTVEVRGAPMLILPTWPEAARVIEDCRA